MTKVAVTPGDRSPGATEGRVAGAADRHQPITRVWEHSARPETLPEQRELLAPVSPRGRRPARLYDAVRSLSPSEQALRQMLDAEQVTFAQLSNLRERVARLENRP